MRAVAATALVLSLAAWPARRAAGAAQAPAITGADDGADVPDSEFDRYIKRASVLRRYRDRGGKDVQGMLKVLELAGVLELQAQPGGKGRQSFAAGFRPFQVREYKGIWRWPLRAGVVSSEFKRRWGRMHEGLDIAADPGDPVAASAAGTVIYAGETLRGYGRTVIIRHDQKTTTLYAHNSELLVKQGAVVKAGQLIARVGSTGRSTGPHLHFELRKAGKAVNPRTALVKSRF